jgi:filamentous hemagglutinin family protein
MNLRSHSIASRAGSHRPQKLAALLAAALGCGAAFANPAGPQIVAGQVSIAGSGNQLLITNSPGAIINWQSFSIGAGELTRFIQQSSSSSVLNRITGQDPSKIFGTLQSNGKVLLINPNGVLFGAGSQVNVNGLVASSLNLSDADFLAGKLNFSGAGNGRTGKTGDITNQGAITTPSGGQVYLIAPNVTNDGIITSPGGDVMLAAGQSVYLADSTDPDMRVVISAPGNQALNVGSVVAESGRIGIYGALINQLGLVSANSAVVGANGKIIFKSSGDTTLGAGSVTTATGEGVGGDIQVLGNRVALMGDATVDASGRTGGGTVLIGGDNHGSNAAVQNAALTYVGPMARIMANALQSGDGGRVVVWSDQHTQMYGDISARGGAQGGNGGLVEVSSKDTLDFQGLVDLRAPAGLTGTLSLDPSDITIQAGDSSLGTNLPESAPFTITESNPTSFLSVADLQNELGLGNVTVSTSSDALAPLGGTITVASPIAWSNANSLTLAASQNININAPITAPAAILVLTAANGNIAQSLNVGTPAAISVSALAATAPNGSVTLTEPTNNVSGAIAGAALSGFSFVNSGAVTVGTVGSSSGITSNSGAIAITAAGSIDVADATVGINAGTNAVALSSSGMVTTSNGSITGSTLQISAATGVGSTAKPLNTSVGSLQVTNSTSGDIAVSNTGGPLMIADVGSLGYGIQQASSGNVYVVSDNTLSVSGAIQVQGATGNVGLRATGGIAVNSPIAVSASSGIVALQTSSGDITQGDGAITAASVSAVASTGSVDLTNESNAIGTIAGSANGASGFSLVNGSSLTVGTVPAVGNIPAMTGVASSNGTGIGVVLQTPTAGDITLSAPVNAGSATVMVDASGAVVQGAGGLITAGSLDVDAGATAGIGSSGAPLLVNVSKLANVNSQGSAYISNSGNLTIDSISAIGAVNVNSRGSLTIPAAVSCDCSLDVAGSSVTLTAYGAMLLDSGTTVTASGPVALYAGYDVANKIYVGSPNTLTLSGSVTGSTVDLFAGGVINVTGSITGAVTQMASQYAPPTPPPPPMPPPPLVAQCAANPALSGCATVLPPVVNSSPVIQAVNTVIIAVDTPASIMLLNSGDTDLSLFSPVKLPASNAASIGSSGTTNTGAASNAAKKMYCN